MKIPVIRGVIQRRILANYRVDPEVLGKLLPKGFRPHLVQGMGLAGICLIRLSGIRPRFAPKFLGLSSENAAHRMAVEWQQDEQTCQGVYTPRRDTSSRLNSLVGGRLFPGVQHHARFDVREKDEHFHVAMVSDDDQTRVLVDGHTTRQWPADSVFRSLEAASDFFEAGAVGYSPADCRGKLDGLELRTFGWRVEALAVEQVESSFFDDRATFPPGTVEFDCALLMRGIEHEWHAVPDSATPTQSVPLNVS